jgi:predicted transcriptional regulator
MKNKSINRCISERAMLLNKIEKAEKDISEGKVYTTDEAKQQLSKWLQ